MHLMPAGLISLSANGHGHRAALPAEFIMEHQTHTHADLGEGLQIFQVQSGRRFRRGDRLSRASPSPAEKTRRLSACFRRDDSFFGEKNNCLPYPSRV